MAELNMENRALLKNGEQRKLIQKIRAQLSIKEVAALCDCSERTIRDWQREKFLIAFSALEKICKRANMPFPKMAQKRDAHWFAHTGATLGGKAVLKKYGHVGGDPEHRKKKWHTWWENKGKYQTHPILYNSLPVRLPPKSKALAEFVGIVLGDGGITKRQVTITLHGIDDKEYVGFVTKLIMRLFKLNPSLTGRKNDRAVDITISRTKLVNYLTEKLSLRIGNKVKQQVNIPDWIQENKNFKVSCVRGLIDTDGCIFTHKYKVRNKEYSYKKLSFTSRSEPLRQSVFQILQEMGLKVRLTKKYDVWIDSPHEVKRYLSIIGSHNPKHLKRYVN